MSLDLDDKWTYLKAHGDKSWESFPSYLDVVVPRVLSVLKTRQLAITFMVVGQDAAFSRNAAVLKGIASSGHEIGNHSFNHDPWLHLYSEEQIEKDLEMNCLCAKYRVVTLEQHAQAAQMSALPTLTPPFRYFTAAEAGTGG